MPQVGCAACDITLVWCYVRLCMSGNELLFYFTLDLSLIWSLECPRYSILLVVSLGGGEPFYLLESCPNQEGLDEVSASGKGEAWKAWLPASFITSLTRI